MTLRIGGGLFRGRTLKTPKGNITRPTTSMVRSALFNICQTEIQGARFLDLYAGSGAMGLEAISRGASFATFVEKDRQAIHCIQENIEILGLQQQTQILSLDIRLAIPKLLSHYDLIYLDPPYEKDAAEILSLIGSRQLLAPHGLLFLEERYKISKEFIPPPEFEAMESRRYGATQLRQLKLAFR